ncbi:MAG TPA: biotin-dependent carboxyltransferase family protein [Bacteroidota bacterium]|nr:biotin-dependent carboxyltransferase family protein [Bacteroidota bacterium]
MLGQIRVISPGFQTSIQDLGRFGYAHLGVSASGAADQLSVRIGNRLLGNPETAAALEMTLTGGTFLFESRCTMIIAGSDFGANLDGKETAQWKTLEIDAGQTLSFGASSEGARCYLCIAGGIVVPQLFGSSSTHLLTGLGGYEGRALKKGDILEFETSNPVSPMLKAIDPQQLQPLYRRSRLRVTPGPQAEMFSANTMGDFCQNEYAVTERSNRFGLRLLGNPLDVDSLPEMLTEGISNGAIQITRDGLPIILSVEDQTTGGYPKIANIIASDLHLIGQLRPRDTVNFELVTIDQALQALEEQEQTIGRLLAHA